MKLVRRRYPPRGYLLTIALSRRKTYLSIGDVMAIIPRSPWLTGMAATPQKTISHERYVDLAAIAEWGRLLERAGHKEPAQGLASLLSWTSKEVEEIRTAGNERLQSSRRKHGCFD